MRVKLDENFGNRTRSLFIEAGHDVHTIHQEGLSGVSDLHLYERCIEEKRCLVTLDLDFANVLRFPPGGTSGIVVIRMLRNPTLPILEQLIRQFLHALEEGAVAGKLWVVEVGRIRIHQSDLDDTLGLDS